MMKVRRSAKSCLSIVALENMDQAKKEPEWIQMALKTMPEAFANSSGQFRFLQRVAELRPGCSSAAAWRLGWLGWPIRPPRAIMRRSPPKMHTTLILRNPQTRKEPGGNFLFSPSPISDDARLVCAVFSLLAWKDLQSSVNIIKVEMMGSLEARPGRQPGFVWEAERGLINDRHGSRHWKIQ